MPADDARSGMVPGQQPWPVLSALPAWQLTQVPRAPQHPDEARPDGSGLGDGAAQRSAELVSAWCRGAPVAVAWLRERAGGPVRVITAGPGLAAGSDDGQDVLTLPAGARGQVLDGGEAARLLAALPCWVPLAGVCDVLLADTDTARLTAAGRDWRPSLEDALLSAWLGPFGWLLVAEPADAATVEDRLGRRIPGATCAEQAAAVWSWHTRAQRDPRAITGAIFGYRAPSAIEQATGVRASDPDRDARLAGALADFTVTGPPWPATLLCRPQPEALPG